VITIPGRLVHDGPNAQKQRTHQSCRPTVQQVVFDATATHERDGPAAWLADFHGKLQADAYAG
jgi:hypothetical protein